MISLLEILIYNDLLVPKIFLLILSVFILKVLLKTLIRNEKIALAAEDPTKFFYLYKIKNFFSNWVFVIIYFLIFVVLILSFRIYRLGYILDFNPIKQMFITLYLLKEFLLISLLILVLSSLCLTIVLLLKKIKNYLQIQVIQRHLYLINYQKIKDHKNAETIDPPYSFPNMSEEEKKISKNSYLQDGLYKKAYYYFYQCSYGILLNWVSQITGKVWLKFIKNTRFSNSEIFNFRKHFQIISDPKYNMIFIFIILIYELLHNDLKIKFLFLILPFYFVYTLWYNLSKFWFFYRIPSLDLILYDLYYDYPQVIYLNLEQKHFDIISRYIIGGLNEPNPGTTNDRSDAILMIYNHRFILCGNFYKNFTTKECISIQDYENSIKTNQVELQR